MTLADFLKTARRETDVAYSATDKLRALNPPLSVDALALITTQRRALIRQKAALVEALKLAEPAPPPAPAPVVQRVMGAMIVNAGNADPTLLWRAGITHAAPELNDANMRDLKTTRWDGYVRGGMFIHRATTTAAALNEANAAAMVALSNGLAFIVLDVEAWKLDMHPEAMRPTVWSLYDLVFSKWRGLLGSRPIYAVTYGIHSSPAVVDHEAMRKHGVTYIAEAYDGAGATLGFTRATEKANSEGWTPAHVAMGDKSIATDAPAIAPLVSAGKLAGAWVWAPEQSGDTVLALKAIV